MPAENKATWNGYRWVMPSIGKARVHKNVRPYGGHIGQVTSIDREHGTVAVFFHPTDRTYKLTEVDLIDIKEF